MSGTLRGSGPPDCEHLLRERAEYRVGDMKKILALLVTLVVAYVTYEQSPGTTQGPAPSAPAETALQEAIRDQLVDYQVRGSGTVIRLLSDDLEGSRHQRFIVRLDSGDTLLIAHNIDLAPRVANLEKGQRVSFYGEYEWNERGGVIHWTHHDPRGQHVGGWIEYKGRRYQ